MENKEKTLTKLQLIYEICYFDKMDITNRLSRANDLQSLIREITIAHKESINFTLTGKNTSWGGFSPVKGKIVVSDGVVTIHKESKKSILESGFVSEARSEDNIYMLID